MVIVFPISVDESSVIVDNNVSIVFDLYECLVFSFAKININ